MQIALYVQGEKGTRDLNEHLEGGWTVVETCPMPSSIGMSGHDSGRFEEIKPTCLVILTDDEEE